MVRLTACGGLQCARPICLEAVSFPFVRQKLSPLNLSKSQRKCAAVQAVWKVNRPIAFIYLFIFIFSVSDHRLEDLAVLNQSAFIDSSREMRKADVCESQEKEDNL